MAPAVVDLFTRYFTAINSRNWSGYKQVYSPGYRTSFTAAGFYRGFRSTHDSSARILTLGPSADGRTVALVAFTSTQDAADSPDQSETCTDWQVRYWLERDGARWFIGRPPSGSHYSYSAC